MQLAQLQDIAARGQYLVRSTLDTLYPPYNNWSTYGGQSAYELDKLITDLAPWPRLQVWLPNPVGEFQLSSLCDLITLRYLMFQLWGACRPPAYLDPPQPCTYKITQIIESEINRTLPPYPSGPLREGTIITGDGDFNPVIIADGYTPLPCYRDWLALGLGSPPKTQQRNPSQPCWPQQHASNNWVNGPG